MKEMGQQVIARLSNPSVAAAIVCAWMAPISSSWAQPSRDTGENPPVIASVTACLCVLSVPVDARIECISATFLDCGDRIERAEELRVNGIAIATCTDKGLQWVKGYQPLIDLGGRGV